MADVTNASVFMEGVSGRRISLRTGAYDAASAVKVAKGFFPVGTCLAATLTPEGWCVHPKDQQKE